jgi:hypothetical protein
MKVKVLALEIYEMQGGKEILQDVRVLGNEDAYETEVAVTYERTTDLAELKEVMKGWAESNRIHYLGKAAEHGYLVLQMEAAHLPRKIGATRIQSVVKELEWS